jgi:phage portal protein BeeE
MEFMTSRQFEIGEIAYIFGLRPSDLDAPLPTGGSHDTYANLEQVQQARYVESYGPWVHKFEGALNRILRYANLRVEANVNAMLKMDTSTRTDTLLKSVGGPWLTVNEARNLEGRDPIEGGDTLNTKTQTPEVSNVPTLPTA